MNASQDPTSAGALAELVAVMDRLRSPGGCPWDAAQTHVSLLPYAIEEVFEVVEAVETEDREAMREELGDLLLQVVFHARVAQEHVADPFDLEDVAARVVTKLRHRHPHVFADAPPPDPGDDHRRWEQIKRAEKRRGSALDGIPVAMPALARAQKVVGRARRAGLVVPEEPVAAGDLGAPGEPDAAALGERLLALAIAADAAGVDAEGALRVAVRRLEEQLRAAEAGTATDDGFVPDV